MKYLLFALIILSTIATAQQVEVVKVEKLEIPGNERYYHPSFDYSGERILLTAENYKGLQLLELPTKSLTKISDADGAGYSPLFSKDNKTVLFMEQEFIEKRRFTKLNAWEKATATTRQVEPAVRTLSVPMIAGNKVLFRSDDELKSTLIDDSAPEKSDEIFAGIENRELVLYRGENRLVIKPYDSESYIWPSVSPDRKHILAYAMGKGAFICDLAGMVLVDLGQIESPVWAGNNLIVGMVTKDDGHQIQQSYIVAVHPLSGDRQVLSPEELIAMYPAVSTKTQRIAFNTLDGEVWFIHYKLNQ
ncbi:hypothetical protein SAMN05444274_10187 [Mariniphaga anaerophila]|uniref:WD40-like Beta Propeller Repeat n=1 Tax=Mariniphaga anaerophila TaxID=1484053 RepID=A0A1M4SMY1_9BACT|nr:hypothetical protein [Mariniphaga anaerophila]SHE33580.1 hypothetical protein SAMN05444274_10187 [Mariniphaga anaerophila]